MIFAAGLGTRLKPLTDERPKALVEVGKISLLERCILNLISFGVTEIIVNIHHFGEQIINFIAEKHFSIPICISDERQQLLDTGGGLKRAMTFFDTQEPFFVHNVDIISNINLHEMYAQHKQSKAIATLAVRERQSYRYLLIDEKQELCGRINLKTDSRTIIKDKHCQQLQPVAFSGIQVISPAIFKYMPTENVFSIIDLYLQIPATEKIATYKHQYGFWMDMGKIEDIATLEAQLLSHD